MSEEICLMGSVFSIRLTGSPHYSEEWFGSEYYTHKRKTRCWKGQGKIIQKNTGENVAFLFTTDRWNDHEDEWERGLEKSVVAFVNENGCEVFPTIVDPQAIVDLIAEPIFRSLKSREEETPIIPTLHIKPRRYEDMVNQGLVLDAWGQRHLALATNS